MVKIIITTVLILFIFCYFSAYVESSSKMKANDTLL